MPEVGMQRVGTLGVFDDGEADSPTQASHSALNSSIRVLVA